MNNPFRKRRPEAPAQREPTRASFAVVAPPEITGAWSSVAVPQAITLAEALTVPAVVRARALVCTTLGGLPVSVHRDDRSEVDSPLLLQPEVSVPRSVTMTLLYEDLMFYGIGWWVYVSQNRDGYPTKIRRAAPDTVQIQPDGRIFVDGVHVPDGNLIRFDSPNPPLLSAGARAIRTCLKLDAAAARYADEPMPQGYFEPREGVDPAEDEEIESALDKWTVARNKRATAYVPAALNYKTVQWSPEQLQLSEARQHAVLEIARMTGVDPEELGVSTTSRSYANIEQDTIKFRNMTLSGYSTAVEGRLSMGDVTPRGQYVRVSFDAFLRTDTKSRYEAYALGLDVGALGTNEIRDLEDKPKLLPSQRQVKVQPTQPVGSPADAAGGNMQNSADRVVESFSAQNETVTLSFDSRDIEEFKADTEKRTVSGMLLPYNVQTSDHRRIRFSEGSVTWDKGAVSRIKLDREHDKVSLLGSAVRVSGNQPGVSATFKVAKTASGDEALALAADGALDGLSAVVEIQDAIPDPVHEGGTLVTSARLVRATLTAEPAFDSARLSNVSLTSASNNDKEINMPDASQVDAPDMVQFAAAVTSLAEAVKEMKPAESREVVSAGRAVGFQVTEAPVYSFSGHGDSIVRDTWKARNEGDADASARLRKFNAQLAEFATVNRTTGANVIQNGYRPDLFVPQLLQGRPLMGMLSTGSLSDATPFTIPRFGSATGASADHTEGTNPTDGTLTLGTSVTVTPGAISGRFRITREVVDAANPAIDAIAAGSLRESYSQQTEGKVYTLLNGANGVGGTITSGYVPSGAAVVTATGVGSTGAAGVALIGALRQQLVEYPFRRFARPDRLAVSSEGAVSLAKAVDTTGRPLLPRLGAMHAPGNGNALQGAFDMDGLAATPAWSMTGNAAGDADAILWNSADAWAWESNLLSFRYEEVAGPANIDLVIFGYFACAVVRAAGFSAVRLTVT